MSNIKLFESQKIRSHWDGRLIQSIPSPKAEPFKQWLAKVGYERLEETQDPEKSIDRAMENYLKPCPFFLVNLSRKPLTFTPKPSI